MGDWGVGALQMLSCVDSVTGQRRFSHYSWYRHKLASCHDNTDIADLPTPGLPKVAQDGGMTRIEVLSDISNLHYWYFEFEHS